MLINSHDRLSNVDEEGDEPSYQSVGGDILSTYGDENPLDLILKIDRLSQGL